MPFTPIYLLMDVDSALIATFRGFDTLTINNRRTGLGLAAFMHANLRHQCGINLFPGAIFAPAPIIPIHGLPRWQVMRHQAPGATTTQNIENGIQNFAERPNAWTSSCI